ncbi:MAG: hypothetical protein HY321_22815 [Armatimonadetes bacterium]|nr:hypothetical protein [Armatimonadota bacterium]
MLVTPHVMAGAAIGKLVRRPWIAYPAALASHLALDVVPHLDSHGLFGAAGGHLTPGEAAAAALDTTAAIALVLWTTRGQPERRAMLFAGFLGAVIDLLDNVPPWNAWLRALPGAAAASDFHHGIQHNVAPSRWVLGFGTQAAVVGVALAVICRPGNGKRGRAEGSAGRSVGA